MTELATQKALQNFSFLVKWFKILLFNSQSTHLMQVVVIFLPVMLLLFESKHILLLEIFSHNNKR